MIKIKSIISSLLAGILFIGNVAFAQENTANDLILPRSNTDLMINSRPITYFENTQGYLARPSRPGNYPGVVMIHEWWGLNDNIKRMADELATNGYIVLAVDLYNGETTADPNRARELSSNIDQTKATQNLRQAVNFLRTNEEATKIASLGWCFGGGQSLQLAMSGEPLDATVIYYGQLTNDREKLSAIKGPVLGIFGDQDASIPVESVLAFTESITELGINNEIHVYSGVGHAFANPTGPNFSPDETKDAWAKTLNFLEYNLK